MPTPIAKRPSNRDCVVAAAWASTAGWMRTVGAVTAVVQRTRSVRAAIAPSTLQTNGAWPWSSSHGW